MRAISLLLLSLLVFPACGDDTPACASLQAGPMVRFVPSAAKKTRTPTAGDWLRFPYPSDHRLLANGGDGMSDFPNPFDLGMLDNYAEAAETLSGFGTNSAVHLAFNTPLDLATLPEDPATYLSANAPMQLVDITPSSPELGVRRPLRWQYFREDGNYVVQNSIAVAPSWGFPLRENTTYAFVMTTAVHAGGRPLAQPPLLRALLDGTEVPKKCTPDGAATSAVGALQASFAPLRSWLRSSGLANEQVAAATVFTTQAITDDLAAIYAQINSELDAPAYRDDGWQPIGGASTYYTSASYTWTSNPSQTADYYIMEGRFTSPNYQQGEVPYTTTGGALNINNGVPEPVRYEDLRFVLTIPKDPPAGGRSCYPIVEYAHGTGGNAYGFSGSTAGRLAGRGLAAIGIDQPMHGPRAEGQAFDVDYMSFNYFNPDAARSNFRQSAIDTFSLTRFVRESLYVPADKSPTGKAICFDPERVSFFGHSHGGLSGSLAAAFENNIGAYMLSGAGGGIAITIMERKDYADIAAAVSLLLELAPNEPLSELHPALTLVQTLVDVTDPINYSPYWFTFPGRSDPRSILLTSGEHDQDTPYRTATAMAVAARLPILAPVVIPIPEYNYLGMEPLATPPPVKGNTSAGTTAGFLQYTNDIAGSDMDTHFLVFYRPEAIHASMEFLRSASYDEVPDIERDPSSTDR